ncbi:MAG: NADH-quinone oxidoreductase subunit NuoG [candidate division Zixibacteria bacterium]|nr:NADH-quinone oxidoreductase subunit NuoG [candidate division Zixibacteria bacterium]
MSDNGKEKEQVTLTIDGKEISVDKGTTVLDAATLMGIHIPTFCWHPKLDSIGACRMCLVDVEKFPKPAVACATEAMPGMIVRTDTDEIVKARRGVLEFMLLNHPLDCPTCDKGGECDLQDNVFHYGIDKSRQAFTRRRVIDDQTTDAFDDKRIGPEIIRNMNRCVTCYKCIRFNKEIAGEYDLGAYERGNHTVIDAAPGEQIDNFYSGNVVEICPVGALTNTDWRYKIRNWKAKQTLSLCSHDADGQNIMLWHDQRQLWRATSRRNDDIDDGWICNIARYGYQYINSPDRLKTPLIKKEGKQVPASWDEAISLISKRFKEIKDSKGSVCLAGLIGGNQSVETAYLFNKFFRNKLHTNNLDYRLEYIDLKGSDETEAYNCLYRAPFTIADLEQADVVFVFGSNFIKDHPAINLRLRKAYRKFGTKVYTANPVETKSADISLDEMIYSPDTETAFIAGLIHAIIDNKYYKNIDETKAAEVKTMLAPATLDEAARLCGIEQERIVNLAKVLSEANNPYILAGDYFVASAKRHRTANGMYDLANLLGIKDSNAIILASQANSMGADRVGVRPRLTENLKKTLIDKWGEELPESPGSNTSQILNNSLDEEIDGLFILGANPAMRYPDGPFVNSALDKLDFLVVADLFETATSAKADVVLPLAGWAEQSGAYVNVEGRYQKFEKAQDADKGIKSGIEIIHSIARAMDLSLNLDNAALMHETKDIVDAFEREARDEAKFFEVKQAQIPEHDNYPYRLLVGNDIHHFGYVTEHCPSLMRFTPEPYLEISPNLAEKLGIDEETLVRIESTTGKLVLKARFSEYFEGDVLFIPNNFSATEVTGLVSREGGGWVKIEKLDDK